MAFSSNSLLSLRVYLLKQRAPRKPTPNLQQRQQKGRTCPTQKWQRAKWATQPPGLPEGYAGESQSTRHRASEEQGHRGLETADAACPPEQRCNRRGTPAPCSLPAFQPKGWGHGGGQIRQTLRLLRPCYGRSLRRSSSSLSEEYSEEPVHRSPSCWIPFQLHGPDSLVAAAEPPSLSDRRRGSDQRGCYRHYGPRKTHSPAGLQGWAPPCSAPPTRLAPCAPSTSVYTLFLSPLLTKEKQGSLPVSV